MSKPGADPSSGISLGDVLRRPKRHPACRRREAQPGSGTERENLAGDAKGKGASGSNREAESTDAPGRGGGVSDFDRLRSAVTRGGSRAAFLFAFDVIELDGQDLRSRPWDDRRMILARLLRNCREGLRLSEHLEGS